MTHSSRFRRRTTLVAVGSLVGLAALSAALTGCGLGSANPPPSSTPAATATPTPVPTPTVSPAIYYGAELQAVNAAFTKDVTSLTPLLDASSGNPDARAAALRTLHTVYDTVNGLHPPACAAALQQKLLTAAFQYDEGVREMITALETANSDAF